MSDHVYKHIELTGSSRASIEDAVNNAVTRAAHTVRNMRWLEVVSTRAHIEDNEISHWQVTIKVGFTLDDDDGERVERSRSIEPRETRRARRGHSTRRRR